MGHTRRAWFLSSLVVLLVALAHILIGGSLGGDLPALGAAFLAGPQGDHAWTTVLWHIRLPRTLACLGVGAILGSAGCAFQMLFRNPLAEPFVVGVSGGAAVAGTAVVAAGFTGLALEFGVVAAACAGALATLFLVLALGSRAGAFQSERVLVAGVVIGSLLLSLMTLVLLWQGSDSTAVLRWMLGSMTPMFWSRVTLILVAALIGVGLLMRDARRLNALSLGSLTATSLGVNPERTGRRVLIVGGTMTGVAVGVSGVIGFLGMIAPNIVRRWVGPDARVAMPLSALVGAAMLLVSDLLAQRVAGVELPVGAITAVLGAPALLWVLKHRP